MKEQALPIDIEITLQCASGPVDDMEGECLAAFPGAQVHSTACFSEQPPLSVSVVIDLAKVVENVGISGAVTTLAGLLLFKGKSVYESLQGWKGVWELVAPGKPRKFQLLREKIIRLHGQANVPFSFGVRFRSIATGRYQEIWPTNGIDADDALAVFALAEGSLKKAVSQLEANGIRWGSTNLSIQFDPETFILSWHSAKPSGDFSAVFDYAGVMVGTITDMTAANKADYDAIVVRVLERMKETGEDLLTAAQAIEQELD